MLAASAALELAEVRVASAEKMRLFLTRGRRLHEDMQTCDAAFRRAALAFSAAEESPSHSGSLVVDPGEKATASSCFAAPALTRVHSRYVECEHGFVLIKGRRDHTIEPRCLRSGCLQAAVEWWNCWNSLQLAWRHRRCQSSFNWETPLADTIATLSIAKGISGYGMYLAHASQSQHLSPSLTDISSFHGENSFLSNFYPAPCVYEGETYATVEHAFQAAKTRHSCAKQGGAGTKHDFRIKLLMKGSLAFQLD